MYTADIEQLNRDFKFQNTNNHIQFKFGEGNVPVVEIRNEQATALISLQGAHVLSWIPQGQGEVIWLSSDAGFVPGKSVRGGIPVCWPWFGAHETNSSYPAHGFARTIFWQVSNVQQLPSGETQISFKLETQQLDQTIQVMWPQPTTLEYVITVGKTLVLELTSFNKSKQSIVIGQALHTYFDVEKISHTTVYGLEGKAYLDKPDNFKSKQQLGSININDEVDRIYLQTADDVIIDNKKRKIIIKKQGSQSTVVWNPGKKVADKMGDLGKDGYMQMLCVESANAANDTVTIEAGGKHKLRVSYELE